MWLSAGVASTIASGSSRAIRATASATAGALLRPTGSPRMFSGGTSGSCFCASDTNSALVTTHTCSGFVSGFTRA